MCYNIGNGDAVGNTVEIEILKGEGKEGGEDRKDEKKKECVWGIKDITRSLGSIAEEGYKLLASDMLSDEEKDQLTDVMAYAKGAMRITDKMLAEKSDVSKEMHKKIDEKADNFLAGLEGKEDMSDKE